MKPDALTQYLHFRNTLLKEKAKLEARLKEIGAALNQEGALPTPRPAPRPGNIRRPRPRKRMKNPISLRAGVIKLTQEKPLTKQEIFAGLGKLGWKTTSKNPSKLLDVLLYGKNPKFGRKGGKFSPMK